MNKSCVNILLNILNEKEISDIEISECRNFLGKFIMMFQILRNINKDNVKDFLESDIPNKEIEKIKVITELIHREQNMYISLLKI